MAIENPGTGNSGGGAPRQRLAGKPTYAGSGGLAEGVAFVRSPGATAQRESVVLADVRKLDASLSESRSFHVGASGSGAGIEGRYPEARRFLAASVGGKQAVHMTRAFVDDSGRASISDGRHRFAVLRDSGATAVPVTVPRGRAARFKRLFGAGG